MCSQSDTNKTDRSDFFSFLVDEDDASGVVCKNCGLASAANRLGDQCACCYKIIGTRELRESTKDMARLNELFMHADSVSDGEDGADHDPDFTLTALPKPVFTSVPAVAAAMPTVATVPIVPIVPALPALYACVSPDPTFRSPLPSRPVPVASTPPLTRPPACLPPRPSSARPPSRHASARPPARPPANQPTARPPSSESAEATMEEFRGLLLADGYFDSPGAKGSGTIRKYVSYMKILFDTGTFHSRDDFFKPGARNKAHAALFAEAVRKASQGGTKASKLYCNYRNGFDKYVLLASFQSESVHLPHNTVDPTPSEASVMSTDVPTLFESEADAEAAVPTPISVAAEDSTDHSLEEYLGASSFDVDDLLDLIRD